MSVEAAETAKAAAKVAAWAEAEVTVGSGKDKGAQVEISSNVSGGSIIVRFPDKTYVLGLAAIMDALLKHREGGE